jgi:hypothetical protein
MFKEVICIYYVNQSTHTQYIYTHTQSVKKYIVTECGRKWYILFTTELYKVNSILLLIASQLTITVF